MPDGLRLKRNTGSRLTMDDLDHNFTLLAGGSGMISGTYADWQTAQGNSELPAGANIFVTDRCDLGMIVFCDDVDSFDKKAIGGYLVPDYQEVGTKASNIKGVWYTSLENKHDKT